MSSRDIVWVLGSALLHATWNIFAKRSQKPAAFLFLISTLTGVVALPVLFTLPYRSVPSELAWLAIGSSLTHGLSFVALSLAYEQGDLSIVYPISRSTPLVVPLLAAPLLGEHVNMSGGLGIALAVLGLWLVQTGGNLHWASFKQPAALYAYLMLLLTAAFSLIDKRAMLIIKTLPWHYSVPAAGVFYLFFTAGSALVCLPLALSRLGVRELGAELRAHPTLLTGCATIMAVSYLLILEVMRTAPISYVVAVRQVSVLFAVGIAMLTLGERPGVGRLSGALASVAGIALIALGS